jgi:tRNA-dependent cyclodipeptide synthase
MTSEPTYAARVKNGAGWRAYDRVRLLISVGQPYHEGEKLKAVIGWINRNPAIREVHVSVNDFLQRHNLIAAGMTDERAREVALAEGALWIARNRDILGGIASAQLHVTRWRDWLDRPGFSTAHGAITNFAGADPLFEESVETDARALAERRTRRGEIVPDLEALVARSRCLRAGGARGLCDAGGRAAGGRGLPRQ